MHGLVKPSMVCPGVQHSRASQRSSKHGRLALAHHSICRLGLPGPCARAPTVRKGHVLQGRLLDIPASVSVVLPCMADWCSEVPALVCGARSAELFASASSPTSAAPTATQTASIWSPTPATGAALCPMHESLGCLNPGQLRQQLVLLAQHVNLFGVPPAPQCDNVTCRVVQVHCIPSRIGMPGNM